jgi:hypothetical protein
MMAVGDALALRRDPKVLYKVTPMLAPAPDAAKKVKAPKDPNAPKEPRKRRKSAVYDADGNEVLITMMCLKCRAMKPLTMFGLRKMADGAIRNQPWCRTCRSGAGSQKKKEAPVEVEEAPTADNEIGAEPAAVAVVEADAAPVPEPA